MKRNRFVAFLAVACSTFYLLSLSAPARAIDIKRSCKAYYKIHMTNGVKTDGSPFFLIAPLQEAHVALKFKNTDGPSRPEDAVSASGTCGATVPNRCRRRAAAKLKKCAEDQFNNLSVRPGSCGVVKNYLEGTSMKAFIEEKACKRLGDTYSRFTYLQAPQSYTITAKPQVSISGDKGCDQTLVFDYFTVQCGQ